MENNEMTQKKKYESFIKEICNFLWQNALDMSDELNSGTVKEIYITALIKAKDSSFSVEKTYADV